jgi:hypothetical protein
MAQSPGTFTATGSLVVPRIGHTATLLLNGKVLVAGGYSSSAASPTMPTSAELYDPSTGTFTPTGDMTTDRLWHTATLLADGRVLIAGGANGVRGGYDGPPLASAELYDPSTGTFTPAGSMAMAHGRWLSATLLADGRVFFAGHENAEIYDPATGTFALTSAYADPPRLGWLTVTMLADSRVLLTACAAAELFDPRTGAFSAIPGPGSCQQCEDVTYTATLLMNGTVLFAWSGTYDLWPAYRGRAQIFDPATRIFKEIEPANDPHEFSAAVGLADGTVLITGGELIGGISPSSELYLPATRAFASAGYMTKARYLHTATLLSDSTVLIAGGVISGTPTSAEIYTPSMLVTSPVLYSLSGDGQGQGAILHANTPRVASSSDPAAVGEYLEIYLTGLADGSMIPPQVSIGGRTAAVSYFGPSGYPGVNQVNVRVPSGIAPGPAVPVWLTYIGRPSNQVTIGVQ